MLQPMVQCLRALGDENRVRILMLLRERGLCVLELMGALGLSQPLVSSHLAVLRAAGLVSSEKEGRRVRYALSGEARRGGKHGLIRIVAASVADEPVVAADRRRLEACAAFQKERGACDRATLAKFRGRGGAVVRAAALFLVAAAALLSAPAAATAQPALALGEAVAEALRANDPLAAEEQRVAAAGAGVRAARSRLLPAIAAEERLVRTDNPAYDFSLKINQGAFAPADLQGAPGSFNDPDAITDFQTSLTLSQPLFARRATLGLEMARSEAGAVGLDLARSREAVAQAATQAWLGAGAAEAVLVAATAAEGDAAEHVRLARVAEEAGTGLASDRLRAEVALAEARRARLAAANDLEVAQRALGLALGREAAVAAGGPGLPEAADDLDALLAAVEDRPDLRAMRERAANAGRAVALARAARLPEVGLTATLQANDPDLPLGTAGTSYLVGVGVSWKLFSGFASRAEEDRARAEERRAESLLAGMGKEARFRVREAWLRREEAAAGLRLAEAARSAAEEGVRLLRVRYENGLAPMVALIDAQGALNRARADAARAGAGVAMAAAELRFRAGTLLAGLGAGAP